MDNEVPAEPAVLVQCDTCNRCFKSEVLVRHTIICQKSATKRRKVFDSSRQRAEGTDISTLKPLKPKPEPPKKQSNWRKKHEDFIATLRAAKSINAKDGQPLPPPPPPTYDPDYIQCPYCQRRFNEHAAERHIKFCKEKAARMPQKGKVADVKKPPARTQYKSPAPVEKANTTAASSISPASSRLPQRAGLGQPAGTPPSKMSPAGLTRTNISGLPSSPSGTGNKTGEMSSGYRPVRNTRSGIGIDKKKMDNVSRGDATENEIGNGGTKSKFCHNCGTKYPVESAKFCCECGIKRIFI